jgi:hypothetical protein
VDIEHLILYDVELPKLQMVDEEVIEFYQKLEALEPTADAEQEEA